MRRVARLHLLLIASLLVQLLLASGVAHDHLPGEKSPSESCVSCHAGAVVACVAAAPPAVVVSDSEHVEPPAPPSPPSFRPTTRQSARAPPDLA